MTATLPNLPSGDKPGTRGDEDQVLLAHGRKRFWLAVPSYIGVLLLLWLGVYMGSIRPAVVGLLTVALMVPLAAIFVAVHFGLALRTQDPMLAFTQSSFSIAIVAIGYAMLDDLRSTALLWLSVIIVFDLWRLPRQQARLAMALCIVLPMLATVSRHYWHPVPLDWGLEFFTLLILAVVLPVLYMVSVQARVGRARHISQKQQMAQTLAQLHQLSMRDGLTGLYNRRHILTLLDEEVRRSKRSGRPFTVALLDLDFFKRVNDEHGHATGDAVLRAFAQIVREVFPASADMFARWGGEEFLLLQAETNKRQAWAALERLRLACHAHDWTRYASGLKVTFSVGVCEHQRHDSGEHSLELADKALYEAKAQGRDRVVVHGHMPQALADEPCAPPERDRRRRGVAVAREPGLHEAMTWSTVVAGKADAQPDATIHAVPAKGGRERLLALLCGTNPRLRAAMFMSMFGMCVYLSSIAGFLFYLIPSGVLPRVAGYGFVAHNVLAIVVTYTLLRLGVTARWRDPSFVLPQVLWGGAGVIIGYGMMPSTSPSTLQMVCVSLVFGFSKLRPKEALWVGRFYLAMMLSVLAVRALGGAAGFNARKEGLEVAMTCLVLWILSLQASRFSRIREKLRAEKKALQEATERVSQIMTRDPLTGLFNRQYMQVLLERECVRHQRSGRSFSVALIDLDHFKAVNDSRGHAVGDNVLTGFAQAAKAHLRDSDVLCRWGGEEFLVLLVGADPGANGVQAMARMRAALADLRLSPAAPNLKVTFSAGVAEHLADEPIDKTLQRADEALYAAKAAGRDTCHLSNSPAPAGAPLLQALA